jgi:hypothetical protein
MAMNFAPLDCPCQGPSSESKKIYLDFFIFEKIAKKQKMHIFGLAMAGTYHSSLYKMTGFKKFFGTPPFYIIFTSENI